MQASTAGLPSGAPLAEPGQRAGVADWQIGLFGIGALILVFVGLAALIGGPRVP